MGRRGVEVAAKLEAAARAEHDPLLIAEAQMIRASARPSNVWHAEDLTNEFGELFEGCGSLYQSGSRLSPSYMKDMRKRARVRVREGVALANATRKSGEHWRLVTLTMPTLIGVSLGDSLAVLSDAWRHFTNRRAWFAATISAGIKGEEFTLGDERCAAHKETKTPKQSKECRGCADCRAFKWEFGRDGYHPHIHVLALSGWIGYVHLRDEWTASLKRAAAKHGIDLTFNTAHGGAVVDVRLVTQRASKGRRTITEAGAVEEVCKYITKSDSWLALPDDQLCDVARVLRGRRMVELLGSCRAERADEQRAADRARRDASAHDALCRAEFERARAARPIEERITALESGGEIVTAQQLAVEGDKLIMREVETINDFTLAKTARAELDVCGELSPGTLAALQARTAYLDSQNTFDALTAQPEARDGPLKVKKARAAPLRKVGAFLIGQGREDIWLELLAAHVASVQEFRRVQLAERFPLARFATLDGRTWFGALVNPASTGNAVARFAERADTRDAAQGLSDADERRESATLRAETRAARRAYADECERAAWARHLQESPTPAHHAARVQSFARWETYAATGR